jgi:hypothetical protein
MGNITEGLTSAPTTLRPTTAAPTTLRPTTAAPTTLRPTTAAPTTSISTPDIYFPLKLSNIINSTTLKYYTGTTYNTSGATLSTAGIISTSDKKVGDSCLVLNGVDQYVTLPSFTTTDTGLSFACWFRSNNNKSYARIVDIGNSKKDNLIFAIFSNGLSVHYNIDGINAGMYSIYSPTNVNDNVWRHAVITISNTTPSVWKIYINGVLDKSKNNALIYPPTMTRTSNYFGKSNWSNDPYFNGAIDDFRMYNSVLSSSQVTDIYNFRASAPTTSAPTTSAPTTLTSSSTSSTIGYSLYTTPPIILPHSIVHVNKYKPVNVNKYKPENKNSYWVKHNRHMHVNNYI